MNPVNAGRAKVALGVVAIAVAGAAWSGCGSDDVEQATNEVKEAGEEIKDEAQQAGEDIGDEAEQLENEVTGGDETTTSTATTSTGY